MHAVKEIIRDVLASKLKGQSYHMEYTSKWSKEIADSVRDKLKELQIPRYKYMVQVVVGERKSQGVRMGCRCLWDSETDNFATAEFSNVSFDFYCLEFGSYNHHIFTHTHTGYYFLYLHRIRRVPLLKRSLLSSQDPFCCNC